MRPVTYRYGTILYVGFYIQFYVQFYVELLRRILPKYGTARNKREVEFRNRTYQYRYVPVLIDIRL